MPVLRPLLSAAVAGLEPLLHSRDTAVLLAAVKRLRGG
jgi:hypothetical protein